MLLPDPCDDNCPQIFKDDPRVLLEKVQGKPSPMNLDLREALLKFIGDFSNCGLAANQRYLEVGRGLGTAAHGGEAPLVVDLFAGGDRFRLSTPARM